MEKSLIKALRLIELLANSDGPRGVNDIAAELGLQKSNVHRMLTTLCDESYVVRYDLGPGYQLNYKLFELGTRMAANLRLSDVARPFLCSIASATGESAHIMIYHDGEVIYLDKIENRARVRTATKIGIRAPAYCVAAGKALLAYRPKFDVDAVLRKVRARTPFTILDKDQLRAEIAAVRTQGYAINLQGWRLGISGAAAPVLVGTEHAIAALAIVGPVERLDEAKLHEAGPILIDAARKLSAKLGYKEESDR
jgi:DNA-binding IclR family transcriptional regulator